MIFLIFIVAFALAYFGGRIQIREMKIHKFLIFMWLILIVYLTLIFSSPYILFSLFLSVFVVKLFLKSPMWNTFLKYTVYMALFILLFNILLNPNGTTLIFEFCWIRITLESIVFSLSMLLRLMVIMGAFAIFNSNLHMEDIIEVLEKLKFPSKSVMTLALSLRFFPLIMKETKETMEVLLSRGLSISGIREKIYARYPVITAMVGNSLERAIQIGEALEVKGYPSSKRRMWKNHPLNPIQKFAIFTFIFTAVVSTAHLIVFGGFSFYPKVETPENYYFCISIFILPLSVFLGEVRYYD